MKIRNWFKRNLRAVTNLNVRYVVACGKTPEPWVQIRIVSQEDGRKLIIGMNPKEGFELAESLKNHCKLANETNA